MTINLTERKNFNPFNGQFVKGITPHNKGKKWNEWMDQNKQEQVLKNLHRNGNPNIGGNNARKIIGIKNGKFCAFESSKDAERKLKINSRNIRSCCHKKRKFAGGWQWFFENDNEWIKLIEDDNNHK